MKKARKPESQNVPAASSDAVSTPPMESGLAFALAPSLMASAGVLAIEGWPISRPQPYAKNARTAPARAIDAVAASLKEFGWRQPIVCDEHDVILAGHKRLLAAQKLGLEIVPVHVAAGLTPAQCKAYRLMDNRSNQNSEWDLELLQAEMAELATQIDTKLTGFEQDEVAQYLAASPTGDPADAAPDEPAPVGAVTILGDLWMLGANRVLCGDSTSADDVARACDGQKPAFVFTDPPYGVRVGEHKEGGAIGSGSKGIRSKKYHGAMEGDHNTNAAAKFYAICQALGIKDQIVWGGNYFTDFLPPSQCWLVWDKQNNGNDFADVEMAWTSFDKHARLYPWLWNGYSRQGSHETEGASRVHQTQKPVGLFQQIFRDFEFASCLDGFLGSGSTLIACQKTGRVCYGLELSPEYVDVIVARWQNFTGQRATLSGDGRSFDEIAKERIAIAQKKAA